MSRPFSKVFPHTHAVLPVVHVESEAQALRNVEIAVNAGVDGVFLINHSISSGELLEVHEAAVRCFPGFWTGVNCLDLSPSEVFERIPQTVRGVWVDNASIREDQAEQPEAETIRAAQRQFAPDCLYFGGVAFKYQRAVANLASAASIARDWMDVVTTSGPGTGHAADVTKIETLKSALDGVPLAIASGITPENVGDYLPYADVFLVATGISFSHTELDPARTRLLMERVRGWLR